MMNLGVGLGGLRCVRVKQEVKEMYSDGLAMFRSLRPIFLLFQKGQFSNFLHLFCFLVHHTLPAPTGTMERELKKMINMKVVDN